MSNGRAVLFYTVIAIFAATAFVTLLALVNVVRIPDKYLNVLFTALLVELVAAVIGLFKATQWFGPRQVSAAVQAIQGSWWQFLGSEAANAVAGVTVTYSDELELIQLKGETFSAFGDSHALWWSIAASVNAASYEVYYFWRGDKYGHDQDFSGVGFIRFEAAAVSAPSSHATGWFTQGNLDQLTLTARRKVEMRRMSSDEMRIMTSKDPKAKRDLAGSVYATWKPVATATA
jgi:hypothetical protein